MSQSIAGQSENATTGDARADRLARSRSSIAATAQRASATLAGHIEHLPGMKRGETDSTRTDRPV